MQTKIRHCFGIFIIVTMLSASAIAQSKAASSDTSLATLVSAVQKRSKSLENTSGMRQGFQSFTKALKLSPQDVRYSDYVLVRLFYEATRDAGFWNLHWSITNQPPNSDKVWQQWRTVRQPSMTEPTATAECDELSALYSFLVKRAGVRGVGLLWPYPNHTVATWVLHPAGKPEVRVIVPTSQIFLGPSDSLGTRKFNAWKQKTIFEYARRDAPDTYEFSSPLFDFFLAQIDKYGGATDSTLQQLRYLREGVFLKFWTAEQAAADAMRRRNNLRDGPAEDIVAFENFARDMRSAH
jgi:hypothetical protein